MWPPNSPDLNPDDYSVWGIVQQKVYKRRVTDFDDLKHRIRTEWAKLGHAVIASAMYQRRRRLSPSIKTGGGHCEHCLILTLWCKENQKIWLDNVYVEFGVS